MPFRVDLKSFLPSRQRGQGGLSQGAAEGADGLWVAQVQRSPDGKPRLATSGALTPEQGQASFAAVLARWPGIQRRAPVVALLRSTEYQLLQMDVPAVPRPEWRAAARWMLTDRIEYKPEEAQLDCLAVPTDEGTDSNRMFVLVAPRDSVRDAMLDYRNQQLNLAALDIPEMALRNLLAQADEGPARGMLAIDRHCCWMVLTWRNELVATRRLDVGASRLADPQDIEAQGLQDRVALEFQRTCDAFARQYTQADLRRVWLVAGAHTETLREALQPLLATELKAWNLADHFTLDSPAEADVALALAAGAALREIH